LTIEAKAKAERSQTGRVITISAGHAVHDTYTAFLATLSPIFKETLFLSNAEIGLLRVFMQWPSLMQPLIGYLSDRVSLRILFILAPAVTSVMMSLLGIAPSYAVLVLFLVVAGTSSACLHAIGPVMAGRLSGRNLGRGMSLWMMGGEFGRVLGPIVIVGAVKFLKLEGTPWLMVAGLLTSVVLYVLLKDVPGRPSGAGQSPPWRRALRAMGPLLVPLAGVVVARSFTNAALTTYLPIYLKEGGADLWLVGASLAILEAAGVVGALSGGLISDRLGRRSVIFISMLVTPFLLFVFLAVNGWLQFLLLLLLGFALLSVTPVMMALVQESFPENRALANGLYMAFGFVLRSGVAVVVGALGDRFGLRQAFIAGAIISLLGLPLVFLLKGKRSEPA
jgi:FSR family fosmidomycin resistance protein-like MFS transporter